MRFVLFCIFFVLCAACNPPTDTPPIRGTAPLVAGDSTSATQAPPSETQTPPSETPQHSSVTPQIGPPIDRIVLDGVEVNVHWPDGDSLNIESGQHSGRGARIAGYNTLEAFGAVQRWGDWTYEGLAGIADQSKDFARSRAWQCRTTNETGGFDRMLLECEGLRDAMVGAGLAHLFTIHERLPSSAIEAQSAAREGRLGMWAQGVPEQVLTSVTSTADGHRRTFDRYVDPVTGQAERAFHDEAYATCAEVCRFGSCMVYIPQDRRFGRDRIRCEQ